MHLTARPESAAAPTPEALKPHLIYEVYSGCANTLRRINRRRPAAQRIRFHSKTLLARQILAALAPLLPRRGWRIYFQCDAWYASAR